jgi:hypothetical protein
MLMKRGCGLYMCITLLFSETVPTNDGNAEGAPCMIPFRYQGNWHDECQEGTELWCATTPDYDTDGTWGFCQSKQF